MAPISLASIHPAINWENTHERNGCHAPLISDYTSMSKFFLARECDVALERYCKKLTDFYSAVAALCSIYHARMWRDIGKTEPNRTSGKIKLTPPADCHTTVLLISSLNFSQATWGWFQQGWFYSDVKGSNAGFWHWQVSGLAISSVLVAQTFTVLILVHFSH